MTRTDVLARLESIERELDRLEREIMKKAGGEAENLKAAMQKEAKAEWGQYRAGHKAERTRKEIPALVVLS